MKITGHVSVDGGRGRGSRRRGSAISLTIMVSVIVTSVVMGLAWTTGNQAQAAANRANSESGFYAADGAMQWAIYQLRRDPTWRPTGTSPVINGWTCAISYADVGSPTGVLGNPLKFTVQASKAGTQAGGTSCAVVTGGVTYAPQFYSVGNLTVAQSATIKGDVETLGTLTINGPTSGGVINHGATGTWKAKGSVTDNNPGPAGSGKYFVSTPVGNVSTVSAPTLTATGVFNALKAGATTPIASILTTDPATGNFILDFTKAGGKPVYLSGNASYIGSVGIKSSSTPGNDTLIIDGPATFTGTFPYNAATAKMNLVINGDVSFNGSGAQGIAIQGSFYVTGNWTQAGVYNFKGVVMSDKLTKLTGTGTVDVGAPPQFDPRYVPRITSYVGNLP